ncbi:ABC transporter [seawater metagenome]|uniref:ABC transporter n=1 Tax=seawater metagenome TaxID=1561972 RepID=A0A5E8CIG8_9ZZZZ
MQIQNFTLKELVKEYLKDNKGNYFVLFLISLSYYVRSILIPKSIVNVDFNNLTAFVKSIKYLTIWFLVYQISFIISNNMQHKYLVKWELFILKKFLNYKYKLECIKPNTDTIKMFSYNLNIFLYESFLLWEGFWLSLPIYIVTLSLFLMFWKFDLTCLIIFISGIYIIFYLIRKDIKNLKIISITGIRQKAEILNKFNNQLENVNTILSFNSQEDELKLINKGIDEFNSIYGSLINIKNRFSQKIMIYSTILFILISFVATKKTLNGATGYKQIFLILLFYFIGPFSREIDRYRLVVVNFAKAKFSLEKIKSSIDNNIQKDISISLIQIPSKNVLVIKNLEFSYNTNATLLFKQFNYTFYPGKITCLSSYIGTGKSTLLKILFGNEILTQGLISYNDEKIDYNEINKWRNNFIYCEQFPKLFMRSIEENIFYNTKLSREEVLDLANQIEMKDYLIDLLNNKSKHKLSGGQEQLISIFRMLLIDKPIVLMDEPSSSLDIQKRQIIYNIINLMKKQNRIVIIASHDDYIIKIADVLLDKF